MTSRPSWAAAQKASVSSVTAGGIPTVALTRRTVFSSPTGKQVSEWSLPYGGSQPTTHMATQLE